MPDVLTPQQRRLNMSRIRGVDTRPEMIVRRLLHGMGYRYRLHERKLPGRPDLVFPSRSKVILVHGCFWHRHDCRFGTVEPKTNAGFWKEKIDGNVARDKRNRETLLELGWDVHVVWECEIGDIDALRRRLLAYLGRRRSAAAVRASGRRGALPKQRSE